MQTDMSFSNDTFIAAVSNQDNNLPHLVFNMSVKPLVKQNIPFVGTIDNSTPLSSQHLDTSKLAGLTNSNPVFYILTFPRLGKIKRIIRTSRRREGRSLRDRQVSYFTHEDLRNGVIYFVGANTPLSRNTTDGFRYRLEAPGVQPAVGRFDFLVAQSGVVTPWQPLPNVTPTGQVTVPVATRKDIVIATSVVASLLLIIICAIIIVKCRRGKYRRSHGLRPSEHICKMAGDGVDPYQHHHNNRNNFDDIYETRSIGGGGGGGVLSAKDMMLPISSPRLASDRFTGNGSLPRPYPSLSLSGGGGGGGGGGNISDSDSWLESSRSRETSPTSSIPPSLPAFRYGQIITKYPR